MRFPDKPVTTAILGVVCGLIFLGVLSSPGLIQNFTSSSTGQYQQSVTSQTSSKESFSGSPAVNNSIAVTLTKTSETNSFQTATSRSTEIIIPTTTVQSTAVTSSSNVTTSTVSSVASQQSKSNDNSFSFNSLLSLSGVALVVALGSMFFVHRKVNKESIAH